MNKRKKQIQELPTDEQVIELLRKIKGYCTNPKCQKCPLYMKNPMEILDITTVCQIRALMLKLASSSPDEIDMEEIERVIRL